LSGCSRPELLEAELHDDGGIVRGAPVPVQEAAEPWSLA
jgi:hypothetical protein